MGPNLATPLVCMCLWGARLQACPFVQLSLLTKLIVLYKYIDKAMQFDQIFTPLYLDIIISSAIKGILIIVCMQ